MTSYVRHPLTRVWLFLSSVTLIAWWFGSGHGVGVSLGSTGITIVVLLIALVKTRFVMRNFMEVRLAPRWLQLACDTWLAVLFAMVVGFLWSGR